MSKPFIPTPSRPYLVREVTTGIYRHTKYTPAQTAIALDMERSGASYDEIAARLHVMYSQVQYILSLEHLSRSIEFDTIPCRGAGWVT